MLSRAGTRKQFSHQPRQIRGSSLIEVTALLAVSIPILIAIIDGAIYISALGIADSASREVVRAVSASAPSVIQKDSPSKSAAAALDIFGLDHGFVRLRKACLIKEKLIQPMPKEPFGGPVNGEVTVTTIAEVTLPCWSNIARSGPILVQASQTCAYNWSMPSTAAQPSL